MVFFLSRRTLNFFGALVCASLIGYALYAEHVLLMEPCPLCIFQRMAVMAVGAAFLIAALHHPGKLGARVYGALIAAFALTGIAIAARQIWIQAQPPGSVPACGASLDYMMDILPLREVIAKVFAGSGECAKVDITFGLPIPWWVVIGLVTLGSIGIVANWRARA